MNKWGRIIVHHSAGGFGTGPFIDALHKSRRWSGIGYHYVILNGIVSLEDFRKSRCFDFLDGSIDTGRPLNGDEWVDRNEIGAHALGFNADSIGVCLIHREGPFTVKQIISLFWVLRGLSVKFQIPPENIIGHCEIDPKKPVCPGLDMNAVRAIARSYYEQAKSPA